MMRGIPKKPIREPPSRLEGTGPAARRWGSRWYLLRALDLEAWTTIALVCGSGAMSPGPSLAVVLKNTVEGGRGRGVACAIGHGLGVGVYAFIAVAGLTALVNAIERPVMIGGALYLAWMGIKILRATMGPAPEGQPDGDAHPPSSRGGFAEGFTIAFLNPKIAVFFLALLSNLVPQAATFLERAGVATLALLIDAVWYVIVAVALAGTGLLDLLKRNGRTMDRIFGVVLLGLGIWLLARELV